MAPEPSASRGGGTSRRAFPWRRAFAFAVLAVYFHVFMEWLFFATKPSFMTPMGSWERVAVFFGTAPLLAVPVVLAMLPLWVLARGLPGSAGRPAQRRLGAALPAAVLATCCLLLIDNFTYTIFHFGVLTTRGLWRLPYLLLIASLWVWLLRKLARASFSTAADRRFVWVMAGLLSFSGVTWIAQYAMRRSDVGVARASDLRADRMPDILMLASDGVEASHMSAYGYERDTTPFIRSWMEEALVAENAFPNATSTSGTVVAMLTSKLPTHTRVLQYQNILTGRDSFEHLPGVLRDLGYRSKHVSVLLFADPSAIPRPWNMRNAFDDYERFGALPPALAVPYSSNFHFLGQMIDRIRERLLHATGAQTEKSRMEEILSASGTTDEQRIDAVLDFMEASERPAFVHLHLMDTHPPYRPREIFFPAGENEREQKVAAYDNAIRTFDEHVEAIVERLRRTGRLDHTVIVLSSDHGRRWSFTRLPLMFFFPGGEHRGTIRSNVQMLDVAPTLLGYLGLPIPDWMEGRSLLESTPDPARPILSVNVVTEAGPPYPEMGRIGVTICDQTSWLAPRTGRMKREPVPGHTGPCDTGASPPAAGLRALIVSDLERSGYDVSLLRRRQGLRGGAPPPQPRWR